MRRIDVHSSNLVQPCYSNGTFHGSASCEAFPKITITMPGGFHVASHLEILLH